MPHSPADTSRSISTGRLALVVVAGAGPVGRATAERICDELPHLGCPTLFTLRDAEPDGLLACCDGRDVRAVDDGAPIGDARIWVAPADRNTAVRDGRFVLGEPGVASIGQLPSLGLLYHSVRTDLGSRVFVVVTDHLRDDTPVLRLLTQRGAGVVSTLDHEGDRRGPLHWTVPEILDHLAVRAATRPEAALA